MREKISRFLKGQMATSVIYILLGLCFICMPVDMVNILCKFIFGVVLIAAGLYHIWLYVQEKPNATLMDLFSGGLILVLGIFLFYNPQVVVKLLPVLLGTFILTDSVWVLKGSRKLMKNDKDSPEWKILFAGSIVFICLGLIMIANPFSVVKVMVIFAGCVLLVNGLADLVFLFLLKKGIRTLVKMKEEAKKKEEAKAAEFKAEEPAYTPWSLRNKEDKSANQEMSETTKDNNEDTSEKPELSESIENMGEPDIPAAEGSLEEQKEDPAGGTEN